MANVTLTGRRVFSNLKSMKFTPWTDESTPGTGDVYDITNIVGDTTSIEQDDPEVNEIASEFTDAPLYENTSLGRKNFTCECIDMQNEVLKGLFGWETDEKGNVYAPAAYKSLYCKIELAFNTTDDIIVLPKVKMNSKATLASMRTDVSRGTISGTCYTAKVKGSTDGPEKTTDMAIIAQANASVYTVAAA